MKKKEIDVSHAYPYFESKGFVLRHAPNASAYRNYPFVMSVHRLLNRLTQ